MMTSNLRTLLVGAAAALGLASTAALAQQADALPQTENARMMGKGQIANGGMMMGDSEMRGEMMTMMKNCNKMMARMDATSRSEEHTSELQSLMRISYAVFCLKKNKNILNKQRS